MKKYLSKEQLNYINNAQSDEVSIPVRVETSLDKKTMNPFKGSHAKAFELMSGGLEKTEKEIDKRYQAEKEHTEWLLTKALKRTRDELGGVSISEVADIIAACYTEAELDALEDNIYDILLNKYGRRKYQ